MMPTPEPVANRGRDRRTRRWLLGAVLFFGSIAAIVLVVPQTPWGMRSVVRLALRFANPWPGTELTLAGARGGFLSGLELYGIRLQQPGGPLEAHIDTLVIRYRLHELIRSSQRIRVVKVFGAHVVATQLPEGVFDVNQPFAEPKPVDFRLDRLEVQRSGARLRLLPVQRDSLMDVENLQFVLSGLAIKEGASLTVDTLSATLRVPDAVLNLAAAANVTPGQVAFETFRLEGPRSRVSAAGTLRWPTRTRAGFDGTDFHLEFAPLAGKDIERFLPVFGNPGDVKLDVTARGDTSGLHAAVAARAERGGYVNLTADLPESDGAFALRTHGRVRDLDLGAILGQTPDSLVVRAEWQADLSGPQRTSISGPFTLNLTGTRAGVVDLDDARLIGRFEEGRATFKLQGAASDFVLAAAGSVAPWGNPVEYDLAGSLSVPPLESQADGPTVVAGVLPFRARGHGTSLDSAQVSASAELRPDRSASPLLGPGRLTAALDHGVARWQLELEVASGSARAQGDLRLDPVPSFQMEGDVDGIRFAAFAGDTTLSHLGARVRVRGRGRRPDSLRASAEVTALTLRHGRHEVREGSAHLTLDRDRARLEARASVDGADVVARATASSRRRSQTAEVAVEFDDVDLARVTGDTLLTSRFAGELEARLSGPDLKALFVTPFDPSAVAAARGHLRFELEPSTMHNQVVNVLALDGDLAQGAVRFDGQLASSFGGLKLAGIARPFDATPTLRVEPIAIESLDPLAALDLRGPAIDLRGTGRVEISGFEPRSLTADAHLNLGGSRLRRTTVDEWTMHARLVHGELDTRLDLRAASDSAAIVVAGTPFADPMRLRATGSVRADQLAEMLGIDSLTAGVRLGFELEGDLPRDGAVQDLRLSGRFDGSAYAGEARLDSIALVCNVEDGVAYVPRLSVRGNVLTADAFGRVALPRSSSDDSTLFRVSGSLGDLDPLATVLGLRDLAVAHGRFRLNADGPRSATAIRGELALRRPHVNEVWADSVAVSFSGVVRDTTLAQLHADIEALDFVPWPLASRDLNATLDWNGRELAAAMRSTIERGRRQEATIRLEPLPRGLRGRIERFEHGGPFGAFVLQKPAAFEFGERMFVDDLVVLHDGVPRVRADGGLEGDSVAFAVQVDSLNLVLLNDLGLLPELRGAVSLQGSLRGPRVRPVVEATLRGQIASGKRKPATYSGRLDWRNDVLEVVFAFDQTQGHRIAIDAELPMALRLARAAGRGPVALTDGSMRARLEAERFDFSWFEPLISPRIARRPYGWLDGTVEAVGDPQQPAYSGSLQLSECRVGLPTLGIKLEKGTAALAFDGRTVRLERARVESSGSLELRGSGTSRGPGQRTVELEATLDRFVPINTLQAKAEVSGRIGISGNVGAANVKGDVTIQRATFYAEAGSTSKVEAVSLTRRDRLQIQERFGVGAGAQSHHRPVLADSADARLNMKIGDNVWVRRRSDPIVALELKGDVQAHKPRGLPLDVRGTMGIRTGRSYLSFVGRRFEILSAQVKLPGPTDSASVYLEAFYAPAGNGSTSSDVTVTANVTMDVDGVVTDLRSEPYLDRASLLNYLATGQVQGGAEAGTAYGLAVGTAIGAVGGAAGRSLGLDVVQVTMDAYGGQTLSAGSYVDPRIYLGFRQPVVEGQTTGTGSTSASTPTEFEVEIEATRSLLFNLQGSASQYRFLLRPRLGR